MVFFLTVLVPSISLVLLSARMIAQERELAANRSRERREALGRELGGALARRLGRIVEAVNAPETVNTPRTNAVVALVGMVEDGRLRLPWERGESAVARSDEHDAIFAEHFAAGERAEFAAGDHGGALVQYRAALAQAVQPASQASAKLAVARVLSKLGAAEESIREWREVAAFPLTTHDSSEVPFALYAAGRLLSEDQSSDFGLDLVREASGRAVHLSLPALYMLREYLERLPIRTGDPREMLERINALVERNERWSTLRDKLAQADFRYVREPEQPGWRALWRLETIERLHLFSTLRSGESSPVRLVAIDVHGLMNEVLADGALAVFRRIPPLLVNGLHARGVWLGDDFPSVQVVLPDEVLGALITRPQIGVYASVIGLVVGITLCGAYLWTLNTRRELRLAQLRSDFVASVSHELKTPLTSIQMLAETLRNREFLGATERNEYLDLILGQSRRLGRLLKNVLDFSQIEQGKKTYSFETIDLRAVIAAAIQAAEQPLREKKIQLAVHNDLELWVFGDADALEQALLNLIYNAIKYSPEKSRIEVRAARMGNEAAIEVRDEGLGIHPHDHQRIFERFYRVPDEHNHRIPGTGLGLALVKHIAESHGGRITVQSAPGQGSVFTLMVPTAGVS